MSTTRALEILVQLEAEVGQLRIIVEQAEKEASDDQARRVLDLCCNEMEVALTKMLDRVKALQREFASSRAQFGLSAMKAINSRPRPSPTR